MKFDKQVTSEAELMSLCWNAALLLLGVEVTIRDCEARAVGPPGDVVMVEPPTCCEKAALFKVTAPTLPLEISTLACWLRLEKLLFRVHK